MKKAFNILSYVLNVVLAVLLVLAITGRAFSGKGNVSNAIEEIKRTVIAGENARLPMTIQKLSDVKSVVIDSMVVTNDVQPYTGYLVTTWKYDTYRKKNLTKQVLVEVSDICFEGRNLSWNSNWFGASISTIDF